MYFYLDQVFILKARYSLLGYASVYSFLQNVSKMRARISQFVIMPPYQRKGFGTIILDVIYKDMITADECFEITVEDPSDSFQSMRDIYDVKLLLKYDFFSIFKEVLKDFQKDKITKSNYHLFKLTRSEKNKIHKQLKLTHSRV
jgi:histone acetyltransferase 1